MRGVRAERVPGHSQNRRWPYLSLLGMRSEGVNECAKGNWDVKYSQSEWLKKSPVTE